MSLKLSLDAIENGKFVLCNRDVGCPSLFKAREFKKIKSSGTQILKARARKAKNWVLIQTQGVQDLILRGNFRSGQVYFCSLQIFARLNFRISSQQFSTP